MEVTAKVLDEAAALDTRPRCARCDMVLTDEDHSKQPRRGRMCQDCAVVIKDARLDDPVAAFLTGGYFMIVNYAKNKNPCWRIRVEVRLRSHVDLVSIQKRLGAGRVYNHGGGTWRWSASSMEDVHRVGQFLIQFQPELGMVLTAYVVQPDRMARSAFAEAVALKFGSQSIRILKYLNLPGYNGELGENELTPSSPGATEEAIPMAPKGTPPTDIPEDNGNSSETADEPTTDIVDPSGSAPSGDNGDDAPSNGYGP